MSVLRGISVLCGSALAILLVVTPVSANAATDILISNPQSGGTAVNTATQVTGTAPANTIVRVIITDAVPNRPNVKHLPGGRVTGTATSDRNGQWIYVPNVLVPGQYIVRATYLAENNETIATPTIPFVIVDKDGNSVEPSTSLQRKLAIGLMGFAAILFLYIFVVVRRNGGHFISKEAELIEHEFEHTHQEIEALEKRLIQDEQKFQRDRRDPPKSRT